MMAVRDGETQEEREARERLEGVAAFAVPVVATMAFALLASFILLAVLVLE